MSGYEDGGLGNTILPFVKRGAPTSLGHRTRPCTKDKPAIGSSIATSIHATVSSHHPSGAFFEHMATKEHTTSEDPEFVNVRLQFLKPRLDQPLYQDFANGKTNVAFELAPSSQKLFNARTCRDSDKFSFDEHGFRWLSDSTSLSHDDFGDKEKLLVYHKEVAQLLKHVTGADCVNIYSSRVGAVYAEWIYEILSWLTCFTREEGLRHRARTNLR